MSFFKKLSITIKLEQRDQDIEIYPIPIGKIEMVLATQKKFREAQEQNDETLIKVAIEEMSNIVCEFSNIPTVEDVKELAMFEIGFIFGQLTEYSQNPKASAVNGQTQVI
jgi:hypothetical protein